MSSPARRPLSVTVSGLVGTAIVLLVVAVCVRLGFWQLDRLQQRRERNTQVESRLTGAPVNLEQQPGDTSGLLFLRVHVRGEFDHARSIVLAGRSLRGAPGVHLLTPARLADGSGVLVNRGWVGSPDGASIDLARFAEPDSIDEEGLVLPLPGAGATRTDTVGADFQRVWFRVDPAALARQYPYAIPPVQIQLLEKAGAVGGPRRLGLPELDEGPHLGYALQWFSFAAIALIGWTAMVLRRTPAPRNTSPRPR